MTDISPANGQTSSNPDDMGIQIPIDFVCHDPHNPSLPCPICDGKGVIAYEVPVTDRRYGKWNRCPNYPVSIDVDRQERLRRFGNLEAYKDKTFENFETNPPAKNYSEEQRRSLYQAFTASVNFAQSPKGWLVLEGTYGCGKTHLAVAIGNIRLEQHGDQVLFITAPDLLDYLRTTFNPNADMSYDEMFDRIRNIQLLILDDLGVENPSGWAKEKLFQLLNYRYSKKLPTVITTNMPLEELDPRISSRITEKESVGYIRIEAPDYRPSKAKLDDLTFSKLSLYNNMQFQTFNFKSDNPLESEALKKAYNSAVRYAEKPEGWIYFMGEYGVGKTHLAAATANEIQRNGIQVMFTTVPDLMDYLRITFDPKMNVRFDTRFQEILTTQVLVLDDLRLASATIWAKEKLFQIIDHRYLTRMPTIITSSETQDKWDQRLATRIMDRRVCYPIAMRARSYVQRAGKSNF